MYWYKGRRRGSRPSASRDGTFLCGCALLVLFLFLLFFCGSAAGLASPPGALGSSAAGCWKSGCWKSGCWKSGCCNTSACGIWLVKHKAELVLRLRVRQRLPAGDAALGLISVCHFALQLLALEASSHQDQIDRGSRMCEGPSRISGPIPPDPTLFPDYYRRPFSARGRLEGNAQQLDFTSQPLDSALSSRHAPSSTRQPPPAPRIRPSGRDFLEKGQKGTLGLLLQLDGLSLGGGLPAKRNESKDHEKENVRRIKEIQKKCKERERAQEHGQPKPVKALWKSQKYENVESKVKARLQESSPPPNPEALKFLRAYSRCGPGIRPGRPHSPGPARMKAGAGTEALQALRPETKMQVEGNSIDFIKHNARNAKRAPLRRSHSLQALAELLGQKQREQEEYNAKQKGHVPQYLLERKEQWRRQMEEQLRSRPDPDTPPGHTMMPEGQRLETLGNLKQSQEQLIKDLLMLPMRADTLSVQKRRVELERKLSQIEEALKIFSRPKVFIKLDS